MAYTIVDPILGAQPISETSTTKRHPLGTVVRATDETLGEGAFIYAKASAAILQYDAVWVKGSSQFAAKISETLVKTPGDVAFAQIAFAADEYGFVNASVGTLGGVTASQMILGVVAVTSVTTTVGAIQCRASFPTVVRTLIANAVG